MELILNLLCSSDDKNNSSHLGLVGGFSWVLIKVASTIDNCDVNQIFSPLSFNIFLYSILVSWLFKRE